MVLIGTCSSMPVVGFRRVTSRVIPAASKISLIASLYFCWDMNGNNRLSLTSSRCLSMMNCALPRRAVRISPCGKLSRTALLIQYSISYLIWSIGTRLWWRTPIYGRPDECRHWCSSPDRKPHSRPTCCHSVGYFLTGGPKITERCHLPGRNAVMTQKAASRR